MSVRYESQVEKRARLGIVKRWRVWEKESFLKQPHHPSFRVGKRVETRDGDDGSRIERDSGRMINRGTILTFNSSTFLYFATFRPVRLGNLDELGKTSSTQLLS